MVEQTCRFGTNFVVSCRILARQRTQAVSMSSHSMTSCHCSKAIPCIRPRTLARFQHQTERRLGVRLSPGPGNTSCLGQQMHDSGFPSRARLVTLISVAWVAIRSIHAFGWPQWKFVRKLTFCFTEYVWNNSAIFSPQKSVLSGSNHSLQRALKFPVS